MIFRRQFILITVLLVLILSAILVFFTFSKANSQAQNENNFSIISPSSAPTIFPSPTTIPKAPEGPCARVNVLMYHHIQSEELAKKNGQSSLSVDPKFFREHLQYLKDHAYTVITPLSLINFFDQNVALPKKAVMITLDDAYEDNYTNAFPLLKEFNCPAIVFTPTGLLNNPDYLNWDEIGQMSSLIYFGNHTWSHHPSSGTAEILTKEISLADTQLSEHNLNSNKIFAYPYGKPSDLAEKILNDQGYKLAFTTTHGNLLCRSQRFSLPRLRVGNAALSNYGL